MNQQDFLCLIPLMIIGGAPILIMIIMTVTRNFIVISGASTILLISAFISIFAIGTQIPHSISTLFIIDNFSLQLVGIIILAGFFVMVLSFDFLQHQETEKGEYLVVFFVSLLGSMMLVMSVHLISFFLGIETLSIALFILIAYRKTHDQAIEAGVKYFVLASVSSAFLLFGMGLIYVETGALEFGKIAIAIESAGLTNTLMFAGFGMMMVGLGFKLALVPFHMWTPDVYKGAPVPVSAFIATLSKGSVLAVFIRFFFDLSIFEYEGYVMIITVISILSMFVGNFLAIRQNNIKRILAYSSISNLGYLMIPLLTGNDTGIQSLLFYLVSYIFTTLGAFGIIAVLSVKEKDTETIGDIKGLFWKRPGIAIIFVIMMLSLAGIPLTAGFMAKFYVVYAGINSGLWLLVISLIISSVIGLYYYLRIIVSVFSREVAGPFRATSFAGSLVLIMLTAVILWLGIFPQWMFEHFAGITGF
jgi:NADH-quinone oxidoreductase subunit N